ncbi:klaroid protein-like isoform X2 [Artemia franciscana]|uniref:klaroid protein-like isoform X2 n=1 Tax=Artemia franciscana TaxID=6661 RepID=UPI0032DB6611
MNKERFLRSYCRVLSPDGKCYCRSDFKHQDISRSNRRRSSVLDKISFQAASTVISETESRRKGIDTPVSLEENHSLLNEKLEKVPLTVPSSNSCSLEYMSTRSRNSSLVDSDIIDLSTLTKTGYTYAKSRSYRQQVTPDRIIPPPNMTRGRVSASQDDSLNRSEDGNLSRSSSVLSNCSTPFHIPRGPDLESDSSPEYIPRRRSVTPVVSSTENVQLNGITAFQASSRLTPVEEVEEEVTVIRKIITIIRIYNERIIRYVTNTVSPPVPQPPDVAASSLLSERRVAGHRKCSWLWWFLLPLIFGAMCIPAKSLYESLHNQKNSELPVNPPSLPEVSSMSNTKLQAQLKDLYSYIDTHLQASSKDQLELKEEVTGKLKEIESMLSSLNLDLKQHKASLEDLTRKENDEDTEISSIQKQIEDIYSRISTGNMDLHQSINHLKTELEAAKKCCQSDILATLPILVQTLQSKQDTFNSAIASVVSDQRACSEELEILKGDFKKNVDLVEATLRSEVDSLKSLLIKEVTSHVTQVILNDESRIIQEGVSEDVQAAIARALEKYDADKIGVADYALGSAGGEIASVRCTKAFTKGSGSLRFFGIPLWYPTNNPRIAIQRGINPGECWAFEGEFGCLVVKLARPVRISSVTIEHISKNVSITGNIDTAPREFKIMGLKNSDDTGSIELGTFAYDANGKPLQTFYIKDHLANDAFQFVELRITSNHGNLDYTCLYRFRVHGVPVLN